jgi:hypothetical protein
MVRQLLSQLFGLIGYGFAGQCVRGRYDWVSVEEAFGANAEWCVMALCGFSIQPLVDRVLANYIPYEELLDIR